MFFKKPLHVVYSIHHTIRSLLVRHTIDTISASWNRWNRKSPPDWRYLCGSSDCIADNTAFTSLRSARFFFPYSSSSTLAVWFPGREYFLHGQFSDSWSASWELEQLMDSNFYLPNPDLRFLYVFSILNSILEKLTYASRCTGFFITDAHNRTCVLCCVEMKKNKKPITCCSFDL